MGANLRFVELHLILFNHLMKSPHDNWLVLLVHIGKPEDLDAPLCNARALT